MIEDEREYATLIGEGRMVLQATPYRHSLSHTYCYLLYDKKAFYNNNYYLVIKHLTPYPTYLPPLYSNP